MSAEGLLPFAVLAAAGAVHCAGMCGGFALAVGARAEREQRSRAAALALYSAGKTLTYVTLGLLLVHGLRAGGVRVGDPHLGTSQRLAALVAGALLVGMGLWRWLAPARRASALGPLGRAARAVLAGARQLDWRAAALGTGLVTGYLPCGLSLAALALAAGSGPAEAATGMALFGLATTPALAAAGLAPAVLAPRVRRVLAGFVAPALVALGLFTAWRGLAAADDSPHGLATCPACEAEGYTREP